MYSLHDKQTGERSGIRRYYLISFFVLISISLCEGFSNLPFSSRIISTNRSVLTKGDIFRLDTFKKPSTRLNLNLAHSGDDLFSYTASNFVLATIDADIANIGNDDFKTVFLGGIVVMCAGVLSALIVGGLLEAGGGKTYDKLVLDTYLNDDDIMEEFLKTLNTEEERTKARDMIANMRSKLLEQQAGAELSVRDAFAAAIKSDQEKTKEPQPAAADISNQKDRSASVFSDYED